MNSQPWSILFSIAKIPLSLPKTYAAYLFIYFSCEFEKLFLIFSLLSGYSCQPLLVGVQLECSKVKFNSHNANYLLSYRLLFFLHNLKTIYDYKHMEKADLGKHCLLLHKLGFTRMTSHISIQWRVGMRQD